MSDTEARRLAEEVSAGELMSSSELLQHYSYEQLAMVTWRSGMEKQKIARAYLNLLTRLETPGLSEEERRLVDYFAWMYKGNSSAVKVLALIARLSGTTQPTSTAGEAWQDIASAPKDGTEVILFSPHGDGNPGSSFRVTAGYWLAPEHGAYLGDCGGECRCPEFEDPPEPFWQSTDGGFTNDRPPTHWMPLPSAPVTTAPAVDGGWLPAEEMVCVVCSAKITTGDMCAKCGDGE